MLGDDTHVVGDQQDRHGKLSLQLLDKAENLVLDADVQGGGGLVRD